MQDTYFYASLPPTLCLRKFSLKVVQAWIVVKENFGKFWLFLDGRLTGQFQWVEGPPPRNTIYSVRRPIYSSCCRSSTIFCRPHLCSTSPKRSRRSLRR